MHRKCKMAMKGTTQYKLNKDVEERGRKLVEKGFHNTMSDLVEYATLTHIIYLENSEKEKNNRE